MEHLLETFLKIFPNHLTYGLLSSYCSKCKDFSSNVVEISSFLRQSFYTYHKFDMTHYMSDWLVLEVIQDSNIGYLGVIYKNEKKKQLVLAHRSTNFTDSVTRNLFKKSSVQEDICGVFMGDILLYQAHGFAATDKAVKLILSSHKGYSLSFTGHSLGAWLASLSVFYCHDVFNYNEIQAVTFDGPGALEMMIKLRCGDIVGANTSSKTKLKQLDIISYFSAPNIVNCTNKHVGKVFRLYPFHLKDDMKSKIGVKASSFVTSVIDLIPGILLTNFGHDLDYILPYFNPKTGKPSHCSSIEKWPSIIYKHFEHSTALNTVLPSLFSIIDKLCLSPVINKFKSLYTESTTFDSILQLSLAIINGEVDFYQFWLVQNYLNSEYGFQVNDTDIIGSFFLEFKCQYKESDNDQRTSKLLNNDIDNILRILQKPNIQGRILLNIAKKFKYNSIKNSIEISEEYKNITVDDIREDVKSLVNNNPYLVQYLNNIEKSRIRGNIEDFEEVEFDSVAKMLGENKVVIIKGLVGMGKTNLVKAFVKAHEEDFGSWIFKADSIVALKKSLKTCLESACVRCNNNGFITCLKNHLLRTRQPVLFILDDVKSYNHIKEFIELFDDLENVKFLITTQHNYLHLSCQVLLHEIQSDLLDTVAEGVAKVIYDLIGSHDWCKTGENILRSLAFIKSDSLTREQFINCLAAQDSLMALECALSRLESVSIVMSDRDKIIVNQVLQRALPKYEYSSAVSLLQYISIFKPSCLDLMLISKKLNGLPLGDHQQLTTLKEEQILNIINCILLLKNRQVNFLNPLLNKLEPEIDIRLQNLINVFLLCWTGENRQKNCSHEFFLKQENSINSLIIMFKYFQERINYPFSQVESTDLENILVIGPTGSGKSTLLNTLIGNTLCCTHTSRNFGTTEIDVIETNCDSAEMGHNSTRSKTSFISKFTNTDKTKNYWDAPGFFDTRGVLMNLSNAFLLKAFSLKVKKIKILLVIEVGVITSMKSTNFTETLKIFSELCTADKLQNSLSLIINKCDPFENETQMYEDKNNFRKIISNYLELQEHMEKPYTPILQLFSQESLIPRIGLVPKINTLGEVARSVFADLHSAIRSSKPEEICFELSLNENTSLSIKTLSNLLNSYATFITRRCAEAKIKKVANMIKNNTFLKEQLRDIKPFLSENRKIQEVYKVLDEQNSLLLNYVKDVVNFFHYLDPNCSTDYLHWREPLKNFDMLFEKLIQKPKIDYSSGTVKAPILTASEIQDLFLKRNFDSKIIAVCIIFIVDKDLCLPGTSLHIYCKYLRIIRNRVINLKGTNKEINSGSFYCHTTKITGDLLSFNVEGVDGENGEFDLLYFDQEIYKKEMLLNKVAKQINLLSDLRNIAQSDLTTQRDNLKNEIEKCNNDVKKIHSEHSGYISNILISFRGEKNELEEHKVFEINKLSEKLLCIEKLIELEDVYSAFEKYKESRESYNDMTVALTSLCDKIKNISQKLDLPPSKDGSLAYYINLKNMFDESTQITKEVEDLIIHRANFYHLECINKIHKISLNDIHIKLSAKEFTELVKLNCIPNWLIEKRDQLSNNLTKIRKRKKELNVFMIKFKESENKIKEKKICVSELRKILYNKSENHFAPEHKEIQGCINELIEIGDQKEKLAMKIVNILSENNFNIPSLSNINLENDYTLRQLEGSYVNKKKVLLQCINITEAAEECLKTFKSIKERQGSTIVIDNDLRTQIELLEKQMRIKVKLKLIYAKRQVNDLVDECNLGNVVKFDTGELEDITEREDEDSVRSQLKNLWKKSVWFGFLRGFNLSDNFMDDYADKLAIHICNVLEKKTLLEERLKNIDCNISTLETAFQNYIEEENKEKRVKKNYEGFKKKYVNLKNNFITYERYLSVKKEYKDLLIEQGVFVEKHLLCNQNMIKRIECKWDDRDLGSKTAKVIKEILLFNNQYYEKYELKGSQGRGGGNSGFFEFKIDREEDRCHIQEVKQEPGKGGEHSFSFEGTYLNEYVLPSLRQIRGTTDKDENKTGLGAVGFNTLVTKLVSNELATQLVSKGITISAAAGTMLASFGVSLLMFATQVIASPITAYFSSTWVDGPYKCNNGRAEDGIFSPKKECQEYVDTFKTYIKEQEILHNFYNDL